MRFVYWGSLQNDGEIAPSLSSIISRIKEMDDEENHFCRLEDESTGDFVQCFGDHQFQRVDCSINGKYFIFSNKEEIAKEKNNTVNKKSWLNRLRKIWPLKSSSKDHYRDSEVINTQKTIEIFTSFYEKKQLPTGSILREVVD